MTAPESKIKVLLCRLASEAEVTEIENKLEVFQALVGGYIEAVCLGNLVCICNEEGLLLGLRPNRTLHPVPGDHQSFRYGTIVGDFFITASGSDGEFRSLSAAEIETAYQIVRGNPQ